MAGFGIVSWTEVERLVLGRVEEGPSLDYKRELHLDTREDRLEALKDLGGMGNGGGGTVLFGVDETAGSDGVPGRITAMTDRALVGVLEDIVRTSVSPPLLATSRVIESDGGFVLAVEVLRSPLGPYMVEAYGERRYHIRVGSRTVPMTEQQVQSAYALALRSSDRRADTWREHYLPLVPKAKGPWLSVSGLPHEPLVDLVDLGTVPPALFAYPEELEPQAQAGAFYAIPGHLRLWGEGVMSEDVHNGEPACLFRLHRDGAAGLGISVPAQLPLAAVARALNAHLVYLSWIWQRIGLRSVVELRARLDRLENVTAAPKVMGEERAIRQPRGVPIESVRIAAELMPHELRRARVRHQFVRDFADRLQQAFGYARAETLFRVGWLYGRDGAPIGLSIGGSGMWDRDGVKHGTLFESGLIRNYHRDSQILGYFVDGVVLDENGMAMACLEMSTGAGVPDGFRHSQLTSAAKYVVPVGGAGKPFEDRQAVEVPTAIGQWSDESLVERLGIRLPGAA